MINKLSVWYRLDVRRVAQLERALREASQQIHARLPAENRHVRVMALLEGAADETVHVTRQGYAPTRFRAGLEFGYEEAPLAGLIEIAGATLAPLAPLADAQASCALAGREYVFCPGENSHTLRVFMGRALDTSFEGFHAHWLNRHGWLVKPRVDARGGAYRQFHADPRASFLAARAAAVGRHDFEGHAEAYQPDIATYQRAMSQAASDILEDEKRFMSPADTEVGFYRIVLHLT